MARGIVVVMVVGWLRAGAADETAWEPLANGRDLTGWKQINGTAPYTVEDGAIVGTTTAGSPSSFLATERMFGDFVLEFEVKQEVGPSNSGVQFRSEARADFQNGRAYGYQCEIDPSSRAWTGGIYDEARRGWLYPVDLNPAAKTLYQFGQWNRIRIEAIGPSLRTWVNGEPVAHVIDVQTARGFIALQVHSIGNDPAEAGRRVLWRNLRIQTRDFEPVPSAAIPIRNTVVNALSPAEKAAGWRRLWDGATTSGWRVVGKKTFPEGGWKIENGELVLLGAIVGAPRMGGDIVTEEEFDAFELQLEFKLSAGANSGLKYFVREEPTPLGGAIGLEYQLLDDERHPDAKMGVDGNRTLASLYDLIPRGRMPGGLAIVPRIGEWQHARIVARANGEVEHWLNGIKVVAFERGSPDYLARVARSKYRDIANFGQAPQGRILLQDHGDEVRFRSIKIRTLE